MKKIIICFLLAYSSISFSQVDDLASLSTGVNIGFSALFNDDEQLYGYFAVYYKGKETPLTNRFEYVYLDKNLNKVSNNDFIAQNYVASFSSYINKKGDIELIPNIDYQIYAKAKKQTISSNKIINIKTNTIIDKPELDFQDNKIVDVDLNLTVKERNKQFKKERSSNDVHSSEVINLEDGSYLVSDSKLDMSRNLNFDFAFIKFDKDRNELWRFEFNKDKKNKINQTVKIIYFDYDNLFLIEKTTVKRDVSFKLLKINLKNGQKEVEMPMTNYSEYSLNSLRLFNNGINTVYNKKSFSDKTIFVGVLKESDYSSARGYFRVIVDKKTNEVSINEFKYTDAKKFIDVSEKGTMEKDGYYLILKDMYFFKNGSVGFMFEKMKGGISVMGFGGKIKATDLVYFETNENFGISQVKTFEKDKSRGYNSDYLFSQYINGGNDVAFFYKDFQKDDDGEKKWNLYINTLKSGVLNQEKIQMSSKENAIYPYLAKEGFILLREFNKKSEYNGIRLEKLNY
jgi:hypothetical protein